MDQTKARSFQAQHPTDANPIEAERPSFVFQKHVKPPILKPSKIINVEMNWSWLLWPPINNMRDDFPMLTIPLLKNVEKLSAFANETARSFNLRFLVGLIVWVAPLRHALAPFLIHFDAERDCSAVA